MGVTALSLARRLLALAAGILLVAAILVALVHAPFSRALLWSYLQEQLAGYGVEASTQGFEYNLLTLDIRVRNLSLFVPGAKDSPFFSAELIHVKLPARILVGHWSVESIEIVRPRVLLRRAADGTANWPEPRTGVRAGVQTGGPIPIGLGMVRVSDLDVAVVDERIGQSLDLRSLSFDLPAPGAETSGRITLAGSAQFRRGDQQIALQRLTGALRFDGRNLSLEDVQLATPNNRVRLDGRLLSLFDEPRLALAYRGSIDLAEVSQWIAVPGAPTGSVEFDGTIDGPAGRPVVEVHLTGDRLGWAGLGDVSLQSTATWRSGAIDVSSLTVRANGGELNGKAHVTVAGASRPGAVSLAWRGVPLATLQPAIPLELPFGIGALMEGRMDARWTEPRAEALTLTLENRSRGVSGAGLLAMDSSVAVGVSDGRWQARVDLVAGSAMRVAGSAQGRVSGENLGASTVSGNLTVSASDLSSTWRVMSALNRPQSGRARGLRGQATADLLLGGTFGSPEIRATLGGEGIGFGPFGPASVLASATLAGGRLDLDSVEARAGSNSVRGGGHTMLASRTIEARFDAQLPDLGGLSSGLPERFSVSGSAGATIDVSGTWSKPGAHVRASGASLAMAGQLIDRWSTDLRVDGDAVIVNTLELSQPPGGLTGRGRYNWTRRTYELAATGRSLVLRPVPLTSGEAPLPLRASISVDFDGSGSIADPHGRGRLSASNVTWNDDEIGDVDADFELLQQSLQVTAHLAGERIVAKGTLGLARFGPFTVDANIVDLDIAPLAARWLKAAPVSRGSLSANVRAVGDLTHLASMTANVDLRQLDVTSNLTEIRLSHPAEFRYLDRHVEINEAQVQFGQTSLQVRGGMGPGRPETLTASLIGRLSDLNFILNSVVPIVSRATGTAVPSLDADGSVRLTLSARGDPTRPIVEGDITVGEGTLRVGDAPAATGITLRARYRDDALELQQLTASWQGSRVTASGRVPAPLLTSVRASVPRPGPTNVGRASLRVRVDAATEALLAPWVDPSTLERFRAEVSGSMTLEADALSIARIDGEIDLEHAQITAGGIALNLTNPTRIAIRDGMARVTDWEWAGPGSQIVLRGETQIAPRPEFDLTADGYINLAVLGGFLPDIATAGRARLLVRASGSTSEPALDGQIDVTGAGFRMSRPGLVVTGLAGTLALKGNRISIDSLEGSANGGTVRLSGALSLSDLRQLAGSLSVEGSGIALDLSGLRSEIDTDLTLTAKTDGRPELSGLVTVRRGAYREPLSLTGGLLAALRQQGVATEAASASVLDTIDLNVRVTSADDLLVDNNYTELQMGVDVRVVGTPAQVGIIGNATVREGGEIFLGGNTYRIVGDGTIDFADANRVTPNLSIAALTRASGYDVTLTVKGTPEALRTILSSDPPLGQAELVSLLVTGRTPEQGGGALAIPREQILGYLSGEFLGTAGRAVGLDTIRVQRGLPDVQFNAGLVATETDPGSRLTFAKVVTPDLQLILSQSLKQAGELTWIVSYNVRRNIEARVVSLDNGDRSYGLRHDVSFGGPARASRRPAAKTRETVVGVEFTGSLGYGSTDLLRRLKLRSGDTFDFFKWQRDRDRLEAFYFDQGFYEARVGATRKTVAVGGASGVTLEYDIRRGPPTILAVEGYELPASVIRDLKETWMHATLDQFRLDEITSKARSFLTSRGYLRANASAAIESGADEKRLVLHIDPGPRTTDRQIRLSGNQRIRTGRLQSFIDARRLSDAAWIDSDRLRADLLALYRNEGMLEASIRVLPPVFDASSAVLPVDIVEGPEFRVGSVTLRGVKEIADSDARRALQLSTVAAYSPVEIARAQQRLEAYYRQEGFTQAAVAVTTDVRRETASVDVSVAVTEGLRHVLREVVIAGATHTNPDLINRTLNLDVGRPVDLTKWYEARSRLYDTGVFRSVDIEEEPAAADGTSESRAGEQPVRAAVTLEEWPPVRVRYGVQVNDETKPASDTRQLNLGISGDLTQRNLFGRAMLAGAAGRYGAGFRAARGFLTVPSLLGRPITSNLFISRSREDLGQETIRPFVTDKIDLTAEQRIRPTGRLEMAYSYNFQWNHTFDLHSIPGDLFPYDIAVNVARLTGTMLFDTRDDLVDATRGWFHSSNVEYASAALGSQVHFAKFVLQQYYYRSLPGNIVLAGAGRLGLAAGFGQELIPSERFFAGGPTSVRGYAQDALGPADFFGSVAGGDALLVLNQEIRFPVLKWLGGVGFIDAGNAFASIADLSLGGLRPSVGLGARIRTPVVLIRIDFGIPLDRAAGEPRGRWIFSIGQVF